MKGIFVESDMEDLGLTDRGYYVEEGDYTTIEDIEELIEEDKAYNVYIKRDIFGDISIILESYSRRNEATIEENVGVRKKGLETTFYHSTEDPVLPHHFPDRDRASQALTILAEYALKHGGADETNVINVDWKTLLGGDGNFSNM